MFDVITIGSATRDVFVSCPDFKVIRQLPDQDFKTGQGLAVSLGSKLILDKIVITAGGGAANTSVGFARQGLATACIGVVGKEVIGREVLSALEAEAVDTSLVVRHDDDMTGYSVILVHAPTGERTILTYKGEGQHLDSLKLDYEQLKTKWLFVDTIGGNMAIINEVVKFAKANNIKLGTNPGTRELNLGFEKLRPLLKACEVVIVNQEEASLLSGIDYSDESGIFKFMDEKIGGIFIMTKGPEGVSVSDSKNIYRAGVPNSPVVERTGAGDAFCSGFLSEYIRLTKDQGLKTNAEEIIIKSIQLATANSSSVVSKWGPQEGLLKIGEQGPWPLVGVEVESL